jgi:hypothetical protein
VLHDWTMHAAAILRAVDGDGSHGNTLIVERVMPDKAEQGQAAEAYL